MAEIVIRPMEEDDVAPATESAWHPLREASIRYHHEEMPDERPADTITRSEYRVDHIRRHDPGGSWVADRDGDIVGCALATKREGIWFLSLLAVSTDVQSMGVGKRLLDASLTYADDAKGAWIMSSLDPRALHRYGSAGFALHLGYETKANVDRSLLIAEPKVREGSYDTDADWIDDLARAIRGAGYGVDLEAYKFRETRMLVLEDGNDRAYSFIGAKSLWNLGATSPAIASRMLMASVAEGMGKDGEFSFASLTSNQQWAIDVALTLKMPLVPGVSICTRGNMGPLTPYIPNGAYG